MDVSTERWKRVTGRTAGALVAADGSQRGMNGEKKASSGVRQVTTAWPNGG